MKRLAGGSQVFTLKGIRMYATTRQIKIEEKTVPGFRLGHRRFLDGVRGIALLLVVVYHFSADKELPRGGFLGVDIFFVLSGFLITCLFYEEWQGSNRISLKNFYARRGLRLLPALLIVLGVSVAVTSEIKPALYALFYVANWALAFDKFGTLNLLDYTWSLSIEEQFYIFYPPLFLFLVRLKPRWAMTMLSSIILLIAIHRAHLYSPLISITRVYVGLDTRADALLVGCLSGLILCWGVKLNKRALNYAAIFSALLLIAFLIRSHYASPYLYYGGYTLFAFCVAITLLKLFDSPPMLIRQTLENPLLVWIGRVSYGLYLWNVLIIKLIRPPWNLWLTTIFQIGILLLIVSLSYYAIERPFLRLKKRFASLA